MKKSKIIRYFVCAIIALSIAGLTAALTDEFVTRKNTYQFCPHDARNNCDNPIIGSTGWPFPSSKLYSNGEKQPISADFCITYCKGRGGTSLVGSQIFYNTYLLFVPYFIAISILVKKKI